MGTGSGPAKKDLIDPGKISAWISLGSSVWGILKGIASDSSSVYGPLDTIFIYIVYLTLFLYVCVGALFGIGIGIVQLFGSDALSNLSDIRLWILGILVLVIMVPLGTNAATEAVQSGEMSTLGLTMARFLGVVLIFLA